MDLLTTGASLAIVLGLVEVLKFIIGNSRFAPLYALILGIGIAFLTLPDAAVREVILQGLINGLSAAGLYSGTKAVIKPASINEPLA
jgi:hypothetical protein